ncbi:MAG: universal stress protein [Bacteroidia bacterium]|nr:universal stress protein [Bacteroidia bacterium]
MTIDETPESKFKVKFVSDIAGKFNSVVHILGVRESEDTKVVSAIEKNIKQVANYAENKGLKHKTEHLTGKNLTTLAIDYASQIAADLIAIMENQPASIKNFWLGAYAQQMVNHSPIPVLTIRQIHSKSE